MSKLYLSIFRCLLARFAFLLYFILMPGVMIVEFLCNIGARLFPVWAKFDTVLGNRLQ